NNSERRPPLILLVETSCADRYVVPDRAASNSSRRDSRAEATPPAVRARRIIGSRVQCLHSRILFQERGVLCGPRHLCSYGSLRHFAILRARPSCDLMESEILLAPEILSSIEHALAEDIRTGDVTTNSIIPAQATL